LTVNLKAAKTLGIEMPPSLLVIERAVVCCNAAMSPLGLGYVKTRRREQLPDGMSYRITIVRAVDFERSLGFAASE